MLVVCWSAKGGSGTTVVASALALLAGRLVPTRLVDLDGDAPAALGLADPAGPGVTDWLAAPGAAADALWRLGTPVIDGLELISRGATAGPIDAAGWERLAAAAPAEHVTVVDAGGPPPAVAHQCADRSVLVLRPCYLALRRAAAVAAGATDLVVVREPRRALDADDVERALGIPVTAEIEWDPAIARAVDAGLLGARLPSELARSLRRIQFGDPLRVPT